MGDTAKFVELIQALISQDNNVRREAEGMYAKSKSENPAAVLEGFLTVLGTDSIDESVRSQAAVLLRQCVGRRENELVFGKLPVPAKQTVATALLTRFTLEPNTKIKAKIGEALQKLAETVYDKDHQDGWLSETPGWQALLESTFQMANCVQNTDPNSISAALELLKGLVTSMNEEMVKAQNQQAMQQVLQGALQFQNPQVKLAAFLLICEMVGIMDKKDWAPLTATVDVLVAILQVNASPGNEETLQECVQAFVEVASVEPDFFKKSLAEKFEPAKSMSEILKARTFDDSVRGLCLEWLASFAEKKPKWLAKQIPAFAPLALECCMQLMCEIDDSKEELEAWALRMDDEEGEEDADEMFHAGEEAVDRIVEALEMENVKASLFPLVERLCQEEDWRAKHAALATVKQVVEYVEEESDIASMGKVLLAHVDHPHPRVRYTALHAIGQLANDQAPTFQEKRHKEVLPCLLKKMEDPVDRVASMAMSAFVSFAEELSKPLLLEYSKEFMETLVKRLKSTNHRMVKEESITSIAVIAGVIEKDFAFYYDAIMPLLKQLVMQCTGDKENRLRGKAFECMSLLGLAVGKEKFLPDAQEAVEEMLKTPVEADDLQREYIKEASERICKCLKKDFARFLPHLLPGVLNSLKLEGEEVGTAAEGNDDDQFVTVSVGEGKLVKVRSSKFEEISQSIQLIQTFCAEVEEAFEPYVKPTAEKLLPYLLATDQLTLLCDDARGAAYQAWASLIKCSKTAGGALTKELLATFLSKVPANMANDSDPETLRDAADGIAECIRNAGTGILSGEEVLGLVAQLFSFIEQSFVRTSKAKEERSKQDVGAPPELQRDDDDEDTTLDDEEQCRRNLEDSVGALMKVEPVAFSQCLQSHCQPRFQQWLSNKETKTLGLFLACDLIEHLGENSCSQWPAFMPAVMEGLHDESADVRTPAAFAVSLAAPLPQFAEATAPAYQKLFQLLQRPAPKKRDTTAKVAQDNAVSALVNMCLHKPIPETSEAWKLVLTKLPLREDEDEAKKVHKKVAQAILDQNSSLLGDNFASLGKLLSILAEIEKEENLCEKETDEKIHQIFKSLPADRILALKGEFTEKQQKKIENMLR